MKTLALFVAVALGGLAADWNPKLAAQYLDARQKDWFAWKQAQSADGPCVSCHTGLTYLLARPALRRMLHEKEPTMYETGLLNRLRAKAGAKPPGSLQGVETIFTALFLAREDARDTKGSLSPSSKAAFDQLWILQNKDGRQKGSFLWYSANLDPWETPAAFYFGAALGAVAIGQAPAEYRNQPEVQERIRSLADYLGGPLEDQPMHSSVAWLWAASKLPEVAAAPRRQSIINQVFAKQASDGGWTPESLGPFAAHADAPPSSGSSAYATGLVTYVLTQAGVPPGDKRLARARDWLKSHQDRVSGAWPGVSMNKRFPADSMESKFMQDAATAYAVLALAEGGK
jgi:squalene-hopene/tetraprenyl-beta-curcumene cyclase